MFCPKCGSGDQTENSYCRSCGDYLFDYENMRRRGFSAKTSLVLSFSSSIISIIMAIALYATHLGKDNVHPLIYVSAALFTVIGIWQGINVMTGLNLRKQFLKRKQTSDKAAAVVAEPAKNVEALNEANFENFVHASVTEKTTAKLRQKIGQRSS